MHIKDHSAAMKFFRTYDSAASKGKWKEFVDEMEFDSMLQEPRTMAQEPRIGLQGGQLVQNTADGSRPGYGGDWKNTTNYKKTREAMKKGLVYDTKTKRIRKHKPALGPRGYSNNPEGRPKIEIKDWTLEEKARLDTWMDNTGSTLKDYNELPEAPRKNIKYGKITGIKQTPEFGKKLESTATKQFRNWLSKQDPKTLTADSVDDLIKKSKIKRTPGFAPRWADSPRPG